MFIFTLSFIFIEIKRNNNINDIIIILGFCLALLIVGIFTMYKKSRVYSSFNFILFGLMIMVYNIIKYIIEKKFNVIFLGEFIVSILSIYGGFRIKK